MRDYELMVVLDPNLDDTAIEALNTRIQSMVTQRGGTIETVDSLGTTAPCLSHWPQPRRCVHREPLQHATQWRR